MTSARRFVRTAKGSKALRLGRIGLDDRHVKALAALSPDLDERELARHLFLSPADTLEICKKLAVVGYARSVAADEAAPAAALEDAEAQSEQRDDEAVAASLAALAAPAQDVEARARQGDPQAREELARKLADSRLALSRKLDAERAQRAAAEKALEAARERARQVEAERLASQEALARERSAQAERDKAEAAERARLDAERAATAAKERVVAAERAQAEAAERARRDAEREAALEVERARARRLGLYRRRRNIVAGALALTALGAGAWRAEQAMILNPERCAKLLAEWAGSPARVASCESSLWAPGFSASGIAVGPLELAGAQGRFSLPLLLFAGRAELSSLSLRGLSLDAASADSLLRVPRLVRVGSVREVDIEAARFSVGNASIDGLAGQAKLGANGSLEQIVLTESARATRLSVEHDKGGVKIAFQTRFPDPATAPVSGATEVSAYGSLSNSGFVVDEATMSFKTGSARFSGAAVWRGGTWVGKGAFEGRQLPLADMAPWIFRGGSAELAGSFSFSGASAEAALAGAQLEARGQARDLSMHIDVNEMLGVSGAQGFSAFSQGSFSTRIGAGATTFSLPDLRSGPVRASIEATRASGGSISGKASVALSGRPLAAEATLQASGPRMGWTLAR